MVDPGTPCRTPIAFRWNRSTVTDTRFLGFLAFSSSRCAVLFVEGSEIRRTGISPDQTLRGGALNSAISNAVVGLLSDYVGKGPPRARALHSDNVVVCLLEDTMTKAERSLATDGKEHLVLELRHAFQETMRKDFTDSVEVLTGRKVVAFMSANHLGPDLAVEVFVLDKPIAGGAETKQAESQGGDIDGKPRPTAEAGD
jgi:uncharacterized protein YbcI